MASYLNALRCVIAAAALTGWAAADPVQAQVARDPASQSAADARADYLRKLAAYEAAREAFDAVATPYWEQIRAKRQLRNAKRRAGETIVAEDYVLTQPPLYSGPPRPVPPPEEREGLPPPARLPVIADFLQHAKEQYDFTPMRPAAEPDYKRAYANIAKAAGLSREQAVRVYAFEVGGNGRHDTQAGLEDDRPGARAISTALGYNQLLSTNSVEIMAQQGERFGVILKHKVASLSGADKAILAKKIDVIRAMTAFCRTVPDQWNEHEKLGKTPKGLAVHAMNLDIDVGPLLQTQKLLDSVVFARRKGYRDELTGAELEMMNLTGDGNGFDMISIPDGMRDQIPTSNFFLRSGYERNPVAIRNNTVAKLLAATDARMTRGSTLQGAKELAAAFDRVSLSVSGAR